MGLGGGIGQELPPAHGVRQQLLQLILIDLHEHPAPPARRESECPI
jgi:hypothetical protein